jgi:hypothetical protein
MRTRAVDAVDVKQAGVTRLVRERAKRDALTTAISDLYFLSSH